MTAETSFGKRGPSTQENIQLVTAVLTILSHALSVTSYNRGRSSVRPQVSDPFWNGSRHAGDDPLSRLEPFTSAARL